jgi:hypothetical protein
VADADEVAAQIRAAEDQRYAAMLAADTGALSALLADRLVYTHSGGYFDSKDSLLGKLADGSLTYIRLEHPVREVVVYDGSALVFGEMHGDVVVSGDPRELNSLTLAVWVRADGDRWQLAALQSTRLAG